MVAARLSLPTAQAFYGGFQSLRSIQDQAIGPILAGEDVLVLSGTGSGKTEAVVAPLVDRLFRGDALVGGIGALYITPTRALANDLLKRLQPPFEQLGLIVGVRHGEQNDVGRARKPNLLITTPESLDVMITSHEHAIVSVQIVVVDETHLFYNTQRGFQLGVLLKRLEAITGSQLQVVGMSATIADPDDIWRFLRPGRSVSVIHDPTTRDIDFLCRAVTREGELIPLLDAVGSAVRAKVLVFANSRREADQLGTALHGRTRFSERVFVHHSSVARHARLDVERQFAEQGKAVCVATSTLELGIDIGDIDLVLLYGLPGGWQSFLQRIGRGNRRSSKANVLGITATEHGPILFQQLAYQALLRQVRLGRFESETPMTLYGAAVQQLLSILLEHEASFVRIQDIVSLLEPWPGYSAETIDQIIDRLVEEGIVVRHGFRNRIAGGEGLHRLRDMRMIWGNFPVGGRQVSLTSNGREVGRVPAANALRMTKASVFSFAARRWIVRRLLADRIEVEPTTQPSNTTLTYGGSKPRMDPSNVEAMLDFVADRAQPEGLTGPASETFSARVQSLADFIQRDSLPSVRTSKGYLYLTFAGRVTNRVVAAALKADLVDAGEIYLETRLPLKLQELSHFSADYAELASRSTDSPLDLTVYQSLLPVSLLSQEVGQAWSRSPVTQRNLKRLKSSSEVRVAADSVRDILA